MPGVMFDKAPIGDPDDPRGAKRLTVRVHPYEDLRKGMLLITVDDTHDVAWIEVALSLDALILAGMPSHGVRDQDEMLALLDMALAQTDDWKKRRAIIRPKPIVVPDEPVTPDEPAEETRGGKRKAS